MQLPTCRNAYRGHLLRLCLWLLVAPPGPQLYALLPAAAPLARLEKAAGPQPAEAKSNFLANLERAFPASQAFILALLQRPELGFHVAPPYQGKFAKWAAAQLRLALCKDAEGATIDLHTRHFTTQQVGKKLRACEASFVAELRKWYERFDQERARQRKQVQQQGWLGWFRALLSPYRASNEEHLEWHCLNALQAGSVGFFKRVCAYPLSWVDGFVHQVLAVTTGLTDELLEPQVADQRALLPQLASSSAALVAASAAVGLAAPLLAAKLPVLGPAVAAVLSGVSAIIIPFALSRIGKLLAKAAGAGWLATQATQMVFFFLGCLLVWVLLSVAWQRYQYLQQQSQPPGLLAATAGELSSAGSWLKHQVGIEKKPTPRTHYLVVACGALLIALLHGLSLRRAAADPGFDTSQIQRLRRLSLTLRSSLSSALAPSEAGSLSDEEALEDEHKQPAEQDKGSGPPIALEAIPSQDELEALKARRDALLSTWEEAGFPKKGVEEAAEASLACYEAELAIKSLGYPALIRAKGMDALYEELQQLVEERNALKSAAESHEAWEKLESVDPPEDLDDEYPYLSCMYLLEKYCGEGLHYATVNECLEQKWGENMPKKQDAFQVCWSIDVVKKSNYVLRKALKRSCEPILDAIERLSKEVNAFRLVPLEALWSLVKAHDKQVAARQDAAFFASHEPEYYLFARLARADQPLVQAYLEASQEAPDRQLQKRLKALGRRLSPPLTGVCIEALCLYHSCRKLTFTKNGRGEPCITITRPRKKRRASCY